MASRRVKRRLTIETGAHQEEEEEEEEEGQHEQQEQEEVVVAADDDETKSVVTALSDGELAVEEVQKAFVVAVRQGRVYILSLLLSHYAKLYDPTLPDNGAILTRQRDEYEESTLFHIAASCNRVAVIEWLIHHGAQDDLLARTQFRENVMHFAAKHGRVDVMEWLYLHGAAHLVNGGNRFNEHPLHLAARFGKRPAVAWLLKHGARTEVVDIYGYTPAAKARASRRNWEAVLIERYEAVHKRLAWRWRHRAPLWRLRAIRAAAEESAGAATPLQPYELAAEQRQAALEAEAAAKALAEQEAKRVANKLPSALSKRPLTGKMPLSPSRRPMTPNSVAPHVPKGRW